jgi:hypothetical protein
LIFGIITRTFVELLICLQFRLAIITTGTRAHMAFTLAHPAAVLPLRKLPFLSLLPLMIGSMTPDLVGFLPYALERRLPNSHSPVGTVLIDLPLGYVLLVLLLLFRNALVMPLWEPHREIIAHALDEFSAHAHRWLTAIPSLLIGSWTHIIWDRFTHESRWTYHDLPFLSQPLFPAGPHELPLFHFLQYATSVAGLLYIGWQYVLAVRRIKGDHAIVLTLRERKMHLIVALMIAALAVGCLRLLVSRFGYGSIYEQLSLVLKTAITCFGTLYLLTGLILASGRSRIFLNKSQ